MRRFFLAPLFVLPVSGVAADSASTSQSELAPIVVSASRIEQPVNTVGSSITVLAADELIERGISFVADAFREVPSLTVTSSGPRGSQTQIRVRGNEANHVLVLVDGMRVSNASTNEFDFANMHLDGIERIEVMLGPQSTLYGSDAAAGVINIITRKGEGAFGGQVHAAAGSLNTRTGSVQVSGSEQGWNYAVSADRYLTDGISAAAEKNGNSEKDGYDSNGVKIKTGYDADKFSTWLSYNQSRSDYDFDGSDFVTGLAVDEADNHQTTDTSAASWAISFPLLDGRLNNQFQLSRTQYDYNSYSVFFGSGSNYRTETDRNSIEYQGSYQIDDSNSLQFGIDKTDDALVVSSFDREVSVKGTYLQWSGDFDGTNFTLGGRSDDHDEFNRYTTYRATASHQLDSNWRVRAAYGTGFKAPSLQELYDSTYGTNNPNLKPEESSSLELGIEYQHDNYHTSATLFNQKTTNLIRSVGAWPASQLQNVDAADSRGLELNTGISWQQTELSAALTWLDANETVASVERDRYRVPKLSANVTGSYFYSKGRIWAEAHYQGERRDLNWALAQDVMLDAYWLFNLGASYEVSDDLSLSARIDNLFDKEYEEVYSYGTLGRTATVGLDLRF